MKLYTKLSLINSVSKALIFFAFILLVPFMVKQVVLNHTDKRLLIMKERVMDIVNRVGSNAFIKEEGDSSYSSYNILKEEYISLESEADSVENYQRIENTQRNIENVVVDYRVLSYVFQNGGKKYLLEIGKSIANISELDSTIKKFSLIIMLFILSITVLIDVGYAKYLLKPFQQIIEKKLNAVKHPGDYDAREIYTTTSDFRYLDKSINEMMEKVNLAFLREKEFTSNVSHELLTPISLLQSRLENILSDENISEQTTLKVIESQRTLSRLNKIITALLMISRIEHEQYLKDESVNIRQLINEVIDEIEERLVEKKIKIDFRCEADYNFQHANKSLLFILVFNLVNNAIKYNIENGHISILTRNDHGKFMIEVSDTGIGIAPEKISSLFDRFKKHKVTNEQSYGLGLPIVKAIADFHSVEIKIFSQLGKGTKFQLIIPFQ